MLKAQRLRLKCDQLLSNFAFSFNLRRYTLAGIDVLRKIVNHPVGQCRLTLSNPP
jgi:hypothetical protein